MTTEMSMGNPMGVPTVVVNCNPRPEVPDLPQWVANTADKLAVAADHVRRMVELDPTLLVGTPYELEHITAAVVGQANRINREALAQLIARVGANKKPQLPKEFMEVKTDEVRSRSAWEGHSMTAILRWMGEHKWNAADAKAVLAELGLHPSDNTISAQLRAGRLGERGGSAELTEVQTKTLLQILTKI